MAAWRHWEVRWALARHPAGGAGSPLFGLSHGSSEVHPTARGPPRPPHCEGRGQPASVAAAVNVRHGCPDGRAGLGCTYSVLLRSMTLPLISVSGIVMQIEARAQ